MTKEKLEAVPMSLTMEERDAALRSSLLAEIKEWAAKNREYKKPRGNMPFPTPDYQQGYNNCLIDLVEYLTTKSKGI